MAKRTNEEEENLKKIFNKKLKEDFNEEDLIMALNQIEDYRASRLRIESLTAKENLSKEEEGLKVCEQFDRRISGQEEVSQDS